MTALRVTFYSYKGGVGRTLSLLNVGALLAANGRRVVAVDLDIEAPGFGLSSLTHRADTESPLGVSDLLYDRMKGGNADFMRHCYHIAPPGQDVSQYLEQLFLMPVGTIPHWLSATIPALYQDPASDKGELFPLLLDEIESALKPDFILFDSRTGRADIAGVALLELPDVVVAVSALNEQNIEGMKQVLAQTRTHPARNKEPLTLLVLSPVPTHLISGASPTVFAAPRFDPLSAPSSMDADEAMLWQRLEVAQSELLVPIRESFAARVRKRFPQLREDDLLHAFPYDPLVPLTSELQVLRPSELSRSYDRLADVIARARASDPGLPRLAPFPSAAPRK